MKAYKSILSLFAAVSLFASCEGYLDKPLETQNTGDIVFHAYATAIYVAFSSYSDLPDGFSATSNLASACDESEYAVQTNSIQKFNLGSWSPTDLPNNPYNSFYASIRKGFNFLAHADEIDYSDVKDNPAKPGVYETRKQDVEYLKSEVQLLRAYYMFELIKRFGGVPIVNGLFDVDVDYSTIQRASLEDCVNEIVRICDEAAQKLPVEHLDVEQGRLDVGAAKAIKAEVLLFAASELWNNPSWAGGYSHPEYISLPSGDRNARWKAAADAAKAVIEMEGEAGYGLDNFDNLFGKTAYNSKEMIFARRNGASNSFEKENYPKHFDQVTGGNNPSQNLVDMFQNADGTPFSWETQAADPFSGRDPRLARFVITNNSSFKGVNIECWAGGIDGAGVRNATATGYYLKKFVDPDLNLNNNATSVHTFPIIRLGEVYLNYAEALNEYDPGNPDIKVYYDKIRTRAGMPGLPEGLSQAEVRKLIRNERAVELCFEGKRFWDLRRWMDEDALSAPLRSVEITKTETGFTYRPYIYEERKFEKKMYFYPIPQTELNKMPHWEQNPLW